MGKKVFNILGPSGSGKTTIAKKLLAGFDNIKIEKIITDTSRNIRKYDGEVDGQDYYFKDKQEMLDLMREGCYFEINDKFISGTLYGIRHEELNNKINSDSSALVIVTDFNGTKRLKEKFKEDLITVYIDIDILALKERMKNRGDSEETIKERIEKIKSENSKEIINNCKYIIVNRNLEDSINQFKSIIKKYV